eukprot:PhF_6_TR11269/c0_g1_i1/m.18189/K22025/denD; D-erythronate 2-dehydrogenase
MSLKVVIIGAGGLMGIRVAENLVQHPSLRSSTGNLIPLTSIVLVDMNDCSKGMPANVTSDKRVSFLAADLCDRDAMMRVISPNSSSFTHVTTIHLAALLSGNAEDNFDLGMKINLHGTLNVMECVRAVGSILNAPQIYFYASTDYVCAFIDQNKRNTVNEESFRLSPVSYGVQKACIELLVSDYTRKGFMDGRVGRLSAVIGRPGFSNSISYPFTGIFTQTLSGKNYDVPLPMDVLYPISCIDNNAKSIVHLAGGGVVDSEAIGHNRVVQLAAISVTLADIWSATQSVAKELGITNLGTIRSVTSTQGSTTVKEINVCPKVSCEKARRVGCPMEVDLKYIIRQYAMRYVVSKPTPTAAAVVSKL